MRRIYCICLCFLVSGCTRTYRHTTKLCGDSLYVEVFDRYPDCRDYYLTDSTSFRTFLFAIDLEHERYTYNCKKDSIYLLKIENSSKNCREYMDKEGGTAFTCDNDTVLRKTLIISQLKNQHNI